MDNNQKNNTKNLSSDQQLNKDGLINDQLNEDSSKKGSK